MVLFSFNYMSYCPFFLLIIVFWDADYESEIFSFNYIFFCPLFLLIKNFWGADYESKILFCRSALVLELFDFGVRINFLWSRIVSGVWGTRCVTTHLRGSRIKGYNHNPGFLEEGGRNTQWGQRVEHNSQNNSVTISIRRKMLL